MGDIFQWLTSGKDYAVGVAAEHRRILQDRLPLIRRNEKLYLLIERHFDMGEVPNELSRMIA